MRLALRCLMLAPLLPLRAGWWSLPEKPDSVLPPAHAPYAPARVHTSTLCQPAAAGNLVAGCFDPETGSHRGWDWDILHLDWYSLEDPISHLAGILATGRSRSRRRFLPAERPWKATGTQFIPLASYRIKARVLQRNATAGITWPISHLLDLGIGWGLMSDEDQYLPL